MSLFIVFTFGCFDESSPYAGGIGYHISHVLGILAFESNDKSVDKNVEPVLGRPVINNNPF